MTLRENRELRALDRILTIGYYLGWAVTAAWLIALPVLRLLPADTVDRSFTIDVPASVTELNTTVVAQWEATSQGYALNDVGGHVEIPVNSAPFGLLVATWLVGATICGLALRMIYHARRLVRRVRGGKPFDAENAIIVRQLGVLLLVQYLVKAFYTFGTSSWLVRNLSITSLPLSTAPYANWGVLFSALVLMALAEIFRRGAALEYEQSLVV